MQSKKYYLVAGVQYDIGNNGHVRHCITCAISPNEAKRKVDEKLSKHGAYFVEYSTTELDDTTVYELF